MRKKIRFRLQWPLHAFLFLFTFFSTAIAGVFWLNRDPFDLSNFSAGIPYAVAILFILSCHEFGHFFAARYHKVEATLPYYLPFPPVPALFQLFLNFGTFGAVIRTKSVVPNKKAMFDIGAAGPIAGFIASCIVLCIGFLTLPGPEFILGIHPDYDFTLNASSSAHGMSLSFGSSLLFSFFRSILTHPASQFVPPMSEIYHYPFLCVGWFGFFITAMNLIPMGQFDGGHIIYAMFGKLHRTISRVSCFLLLAVSLPSVLDALLRSILAVIKKHEFGQIIPFAQYSWSAWMAWALIALFVVKLDHPPVADDAPIGRMRMIVGFSTILIFIVSFSFNPFSMSF
jgi:membrane-associated protease RseP (regulator of RpoE activity)